MLPSPAQAYTLLKTRAARIPDARLRERYLRSTPTYRQIVALAETQTPGVPQNQPR